MKTTHRALILGVATECVTTALFVASRNGNGSVYGITVLSHIPALILVWLVGWPWVLAMAIEAALWSFGWFLLLSALRGNKKELTRLSLSAPE